MRTASRNSRHSRGKVIATRLGAIATGAMFLVGVNAGAAQASMSYSGDFSWRATEVKRLANCASTEWYNNGKVGDEITNCNSAGSNSYWDSEHLTAATVQTLSGKKVAYRSDKSCPSKRGYQYVKCFYVGGKSTGNPVITVSIISSGLGGQDVAVDWYYL